ncbi:MAG: hypothetical protein QXO54_03195 [Candidatus Methanomethylicaceae archaeon]
MRRSRMGIMTPANAKKGLGISKRGSWARVIKLPDHAGPWHLWRSLPAG